MATTKALLNWIKTDVTTPDNHIKWNSYVDTDRLTVSGSVSDVIHDILKKHEQAFHYDVMKNEIKVTEVKVNNTEMKENNTMKNVLFLAPGYNYAKSVVTNQSKELDRKKIPYNASIEPMNFYIHTDKIHIEIVYMDPIKWTPDLFQKRDAVFGKKELIEKAKETFFAYIINKPHMSLSKYIRDIHSDVVHEEPVKPRETYIPEIKNAYFNNPVTVVMWEDGTKTMVRCQDGDVYSAETGLALCIAKKALGNMPNFNNIFHKWIPEDLANKNVVVKVEGVDFAKAVNDVDFLGKFKGAIQRAFGTEV